MSHYYSIVLPLPLVSTQPVYQNSNSVRSSFRILEVCTVMVGNIGGLLLQTERLECHLAGICAVTVQTEAIALMGRTGQTLEH